MVETRGRVRQPHRAREPRDAARPARACAATAGSTRSSRCATWASTSTGRPARCRSATSSGSGWRGRCCTSPRSSSSTSPRTGSTRSASPTSATLLKQLATERGITVFLSSHILSEVQQLATRIGIIHEGRLLEEIGYDELRQRNREYLEFDGRRTRSAPRGCSRRSAACSDFAVHEDGAVRVYDGLRARRGVQPRRSWRPASASRRLAHVRGEPRGPLREAHGRRGRRGAPLPRGGTGRGGGAMMMRALRAEFLKLKRSRMPLWTALVVPSATRRSRPR